MKHFHRILFLSAFVFFLPFSQTDILAHEEVERLMKDMGQQLKSIRGNDDKEAVLAALAKMQTVASQAQEKTPHTIESGESERTLEEYQNGMQKFIEKISAISDEVSAAERIDGNAIFSQIKDMKDQSHDYFSID